VDYLRNAERLTSPEHNSQLLYFTSTSVLHGGDGGLVFISDRSGHPNLFHLDLRSGAERQLTDNSEGTLMAYVYFGGAPNRGFGKASVSLDPVNSIAYYVQGSEIRAAHTDGTERVLAVLPAGQVTAFTHVSQDGTRLCVPTTDARVLDGAAEPLPDGVDVPSYYETQDPSYDVDERVQVEGLSSYLRVYHTTTGDEIDVVPVPRAWVTHVQFSPSDNSQILYNHEYCSDAGVRRVWLWDGMRHRPLRDEAATSAFDPARSRHDWITHETWQRDGAYAIYHGGLGSRYHEPPCFVGRVNIADTADRQEVLFDDDWNQYGHFSVGLAGQLVTDGYYRTPETADGWGQWITIAHVDWDARTIEWDPLTRHGSSWTTQDAHPHPIFDHACSAVYFTSDHGGSRAVYRVDL
jgi:oligogalacturonide lyase